jgi:4'-phosphopantetheinyl transferase EntD
MLLTIPLPLNNFKILILEANALSKSGIELFDSEIRELENINQPQRKNSFLGIRHLRNLLNIKYPIKYNANGKPYIEQESSFISISHSKDYLGLALADFPIGIDIEVVDRNAFKVINKFASEHEINLYTIAPRDWALEMWCVKESVYKLANTPGLSFKNQIFIQSRFVDGNLIGVSGTILFAEETRVFEALLHKNQTILVAVAYFKDKP